MLFALMNTVKNIFPVSQKQKISLRYNKIPCVFPVWKKQEPNSLFSLCRGHPLTVLVLHTMNTKGTFTLDNEKAKATSQIHFYFSMGFYQIPLIDFVHFDHVRAKV